MTIAKERPILFSAPMVRALLDGSKTQTRRIVKPQPTFEDGGLTAVNWNPYGQPGDRLWVRETWRIGAWREDDGEIAVDYMADNFNRREWLQVPEQDDFEKYWLQCCDDCDKAGIKTDEEGKYHWEPGQSPCRIRPSIFMPRWALRITLEIVRVHVERLQNISQKDVFAEGVKLPVDAETKAPLLRMTGKYPPSQYLTKETMSDERAYCVAHYASLFESINGPGSWDANPWVWVIEFKRVDHAPA